MPTASRAMVSLSPRVCSAYVPLWSRWRVGRREAAEQGPVVGQRLHTELVMEKIGQLEAGAIQVAGGDLRGLTQCQPPPLAVVAGGLPVAGVV